VLVALFVTSATSGAHDVKASTGKPILEIVLGLEHDGYGPITEISFEKGRWEVEVYKDGTAYEVLIDPETGKIIAQRLDDGDPKPPAHAKRLSEILQNLETLGYSRISEVSFERSRWEIEAYRDRSKRELRVDPVTGRVVSDRSD
jgi:hypothetical protein